VLGQDVHVATTESLAVVAAAALAGSAVQASRARVCWPQVVLFAPAALVGAVLGTLTGEAVSDAVLLMGFVPVLLGAAGIHVAARRPPGATMTAPVPHSTVTVR
jgi:uncharacterized membrane protein YfcA